MTVTCQPRTEIPPVVQRRGGNHTESDYVTGLKSTLNAWLGQEATMQRQVIQQCPRPRVQSTHMTPCVCVCVCVCACARKTEKETDCELTLRSQCETPVCTVTLLFMDVWLFNNKALCGQCVLGTYLKMNAQKGSLAQWLYLLLKATGHIMREKTQQCDVRVRLFPSPLIIQSQCSTSQEELNVRFMGLMVKPQQELKFQLSMIKLSVSATFIQQWLLYMIVF